MTTYDQLHALATEIDTKMERRKADALAAAQRPTRLPIPGGLGTVTVSGTGHLTSVDLDRNRVGGTNGAALGRQVAAAIREAEAQAAAEMRRRIGTTDE